jgi:glycosyltransferase involved in cell wall biosynthesis
MILSIITINFNNAAGLEKTMRSVLSQTDTDFEYVVIDGGSNDGSVNVIKSLEASFGNRLHWVSEPDKGIYHAMNKGIRKSGGEYLEFLNSGDCLVDDKVVEKMVGELKGSGCPSIIYGNMLKSMSDGRILRDRCFAGDDITLQGMYHGCLNHSPAYIKRALFDKYGLYDESLRICSDWKWYVSSIVLGDERPVYVDLDVTLFDMTGISETNKELLESERTSLLKEMIPAGILTDYDKWYSSVDMVKRLQRYPVVFKIVRFLERCLFQIDKRQGKEVVKI